MNATINEDEFEQIAETCLKSMKEIKEKSFNKWLVLGLIPEAIYYLTSNKNAKVEVEGIRFNDNLLAILEEVKDALIKKAKATAGCTVGGAIVGAAIGSMIPAVGTLVGAIVGGICGIIVSSIHCKINIDKKSEGKIQVSEREYLRQQEKIFDLDEINKYDINDLNQIYLRLKGANHPDNYTNFPQLYDSRRKKTYKIMFAYKMIKKMKGWNNENPPQQE